MLVDACAPAEHLVKGDGAGDVLEEGDIANWLNVNPRCEQFDGRGDEWVRTEPRKSGMKSLPPTEEVHLKA